MKAMKIAFFMKQGLDTFINPIIDELSEEFEAKKIIVTEYRQIDEGMEWADICWFEWCDELVAYGCRHRLAENKKIICRLHSYEVFTEYPVHVNWSNVDCLIFVSELIKRYFNKQISLPDNKTIVIPNGVDVEKFKFKERVDGFNIAYVGYINYKKGPMLLIHTLKAIINRDSRYKLYIAGQFQDLRDLLYFNQMISEMGLKDNLIYQGWQNNVDEWLEDKNYILCTSILEAQPMGIMQAMCKGIKPVIHNFVGAKEIFDKKYVWNTIDEAVEMILSNDYNSFEYRKFIEDNYDYRDKIYKIKNLILGMSGVVNTNEDFERP